jgi:hypothetical protein
MQAFVLVHPIEVMFVLALVAILVQTAKTSTNALKILAQI